MSGSVDERVQPHRGHLGLFRREGRRARQAREPARTGIAFFEEFLAKEAVELGEKIGASHAEDFRVLDLS
jgi:hypothetical protein